MQKFPGRRADAGRYTLVRQEGAVTLGKFCIGTYVSGFNQPTLARDGSKRRLTSLSADDVASIYEREIMKTPNIIMPIPTNFVTVMASPNKNQAAMAFTT